MIDKFYVLGDTIKYMIEKKRLEVLEERNKNIVTYGCSNQTRSLER